MSVLPLFSSANPVSPPQPLPSGAGKPRPSRTGRPPQRPPARSRTAARTSGLAALLAVVLVLAPAPRAQIAPGQDAPDVAQPDRQPVRIHVDALGFSVGDTDDGPMPSQVAVPVRIVAPIAPGVSLSARTAFASASWTDREGISGLGDVQLGASALLPVGTASAVASLRANLPTGQRTLERAQAETAYLIGQSFFGFPLPTFGQGLNLAPAITVALPVGETLALGAGVSYQYRGAFDPVEGVDATFDPGDELMLTAGLDALLGESTVAALDVSYIAYGTDTYAGNTFDVGDGLEATGLVTHSLGETELRLAGRVRLRGDGTAPPVQTAPEAIVPFGARLLAEAIRTLTPTLRLGASVQARRYDASDAFEAYTLLDLAVRPEVDLAPGFTLRGHLGGTLGDLTAVRLGAGATYEL